MVKTGFRGERKRNPHPSLSQGEGECGDGKSKETSPLALSKGGIRDGKVEGNVVKTSLFSHTQLSLATFKGENCGESFIR